MASAVGVSILGIGKKKMMVLGVGAAVRAIAGCWWKVLLWQSLLGI